MAYDPKSNPPFPKSRGDTIRSQDWNDAVNEVVRLGTDKVNKAGDAITGSLTVAGNVGIGVTNPQRALSVNSALNVDQANANNGSVNPGITFGSSSGEGIASKRTSGGNQSGLDLYTNNVARLSITNSGNVGVGTTNPQQGRLMIEDAASPLSLRETGQAPTAGGLWRMALDAGILRFDANTATAGDFSSYASPVTMNAAGNVGIGTTPQTTKLFVASTAGGIAVDSGATNTVALTLRSSGAGWGSGLQLLNATANTGRNYGLYAGGDGSLHVADVTAGTDRLLINNAGNVGIGTTGPLFKLHVVGPGGFGGEDSNGVSQAGNVPLVAQSNGTAIGIINANGRQAFALNIDGNAGTNNARGVPTFYDKYDGNWRPCISLKNGNVGIGTTGPEAKLHVVGGEIRLEAGQRFYSPGRLHIHGEELLYILNKSGAVVGREWGGSGNLTVQGEVWLGTADQLVHIGGNKTGIFMQLHDDLWFSDPQNGTIQIRNANDSNWGTMVGFFNNQSSIKYKKDISALKKSDLANLLDDALKTDVVRYRYKGEDKTSRLRLGVITENCPEYLIGEDSESLSSTEYTAMLHGALKALANRVAALENRTSA